MNDHCVELVGVSSLDNWSLKTGQKWIHSLGEEWCILLVAIDLFVGQLTVQIILVKRESKWKLYVVRKLSLVHVKSFHLDDQNARYYKIQSQSY